MVDPTSWESPNEKISANIAKLAKHKFWIEILKVFIEDKNNIHNETRKMVRQVKSAFNDLQEEIESQNSQYAKTSEKIGMERANHNAFDCQRLIRYSREVLKEDGVVNFVSKK